MLKSLGPVPFAADAWMRIGLCHPEGPVIDLMVIEARGRFVRTLASAFSRAPWASSDEEVGYRIVSEMNEATELCGNGLI